MLVLRGSPRLAFRERFALNFLWMAGVLYWLGAVRWGAPWQAAAQVAAALRSARPPHSATTLFCAPPNCRPSWRPAGTAP